jgi:hypothetical protein
MDLVPTFLFYHFLLIVNEKDKEMETLSTKSNNNFNT